MGQCNERISESDINSSQKDHPRKKTGTEFNVERELEFYDKLIEGKDEHSTTKHSPSKGGDVPSEDGGNREEEEKIGVVIQAMEEKCLGFQKEMKSKKRELVVKSKAWAKKVEEVRAENRVEIRSLKKEQKKLAKMCNSLQVENKKKEFLVVHHQQVFFRLFEFQWISYENPSRG